MNTQADKRKSKEAIYIETSFISYLVAKPSKDPLVLARQIQCKMFLEKFSQQYELVVSDIVINEIGAGDFEKAQNRLDFIKYLSIYLETPESVKLAKNIVQSSILPIKAFADSLHIAIASENNCDYIVTLNMKHLANPFIIKRLTHYFNSIERKLPTIITPEQFLEIHNE